jgi:hypothetical protein
MTWLRTLPFAAAMYIFVSTAGASSSAPKAHYRFLMWLAPTLEKFPRRHKFAIGDRIEALALDVLT